MRKLLLALLFGVGTVHADDDLKHLAEAIYFEARSEPLACQIIVAQNILNRVDQERFPNTVEGVVHQRRKKNGKWICQFSYYCDGKSDRMTNTTAEIKSYQVASMVLLNQVPDLSEGSDHYYAHKIVTPTWAPSMTDVFVCGDHTFGKLKW